MSLLAIDAAGPCHRKGFRKAHHQPPGVELRQTQQPHAQHNGAIELADPITAAQGSPGAGPLPDKTHLLQELLIGDRRQQAHAQHGGIALVDPQAAAGAGGLAKEGQLTPPGIHLPTPKSLLPLLGLLGGRCRTKGAQGADQDQQRSRGPQ